MRRLSTLLLVGLLAVMLAACGSGGKTGGGDDGKTSGDGSIPSGIYQFVYIGDAEGNYAPEKNEHTNKNGKTVRLTEEMYQRGDAWYFNIEKDGKGTLTDTASGVQDKPVTFRAGSFTDEDGNTVSYTKKDDKFWYEESKDNWVVMEQASQGTLDLIKAGKGGSVPLAEAEPGDLVCLGRYEQIPGNDSTEPIYWRVLEKEDNNLLLLSDKLLDAFAYSKTPESETKNGLSWGVSTLREFLNEEFIDTCFTGAEEALLVTSQVHNWAANDILSEYWKFKQKPYKQMRRQNRKGGKDTYDKVFLLSVDEVMKYLEADPAAPKDSNADYPFSELPVEKNRVAYVTKAVAGQGTGFFDSNTLEGAWITRTLCNLDGGAATGVVYVTGEGQFFNYYTEQPMMIRPALRVSAVSVES